MTTLKSFQAEIEAFSHDKQREAINKAREQHHAAELARHHGKLPAKKEPKEPIIEVKVDEEEQPEVPLEVS